MLKDIFELRPRYNEVDQMGYVYHANYVSYCHQARTEFMRKLGIEDHKLESMQIMMPVIGINLRYHNPAHYDEPLTITTTIPEIPSTRFSFRFEIRNREERLICSADSTVVFVDRESRKPLRAPAVVLEKLNEQIALAL